MHTFRFSIASLLLFFSTLSFSQQVVPIVWPFSVGSNQVNFIRAITDEANKQQSKYTFIVEFKAGAGGAIAAHYVKNYKGLALLSSSSSFFSRPEFYPNESHRVDDFKPVYIECTGQPYGILSSKFKNMDELRQQQRLTIGANYGSITEAMVRELQMSLPSTEVVIVPYASGTMQATQEVVAGRMDLNVDLPGESMQWIESGKINVVGASGTIENKNFKTFYGQGYSGFTGLTSSYAMYTSSSTSASTIKELHEIFTKAAAASGHRLQDFYARDYCAPANLSLAQTNNLFDKWSKYWPEKLAKLKQ